MKTTCDREEQMRMHFVLWGPISGEKWSLNPGQILTVLGFSEVTICETEEQMKTRSTYRCWRGGLAVVARQRVLGGFQLAAELRMMI
jgi:hypothetical protein